MRKAGTVHYRDMGPEIGIKQAGVTCNLPNRKIESGYILRNGAVLLESERDAVSGCYRGGSGMGGLYLRTGELYRPVYADGKISAFRQVQPENYLAAAEMSLEQNANSYDGIINNESPKPSLRDTLQKWQQESGKRVTNSPDLSREQER